MGGPRINVNQVRQVIAAQPRTFEYTDIAREAGISTASAHKIINEMMAEGSVIVDHKVGRRKLYAISSNGSNSGDVKPNITMLPPAKRFEYVGDVVDMVAQGITPSALITGVSGIGKTYVVKDRLKANGLEEDMDYVFINAHASPLGLYCLLYRHQRQRLVFDDCDSVFADEKAINILKAALDSYDTRKICWHSTKGLPDDVEPSFEFEGQILFVSNRTADRIDEAVKSRTITIDLQMSRQEICDYIHTISHKIDVGLPEEDKDIVLAELKNVADRFDQFNIRTFIKACRIYKAAMRNDKDWLEMLSVII